MSFIEDPLTGNRARVNKENHLETRTVTTPESLHRTDEGAAYNINTGVINLTSSNASGVLYFENNEDQPVVIEAIAVGIGDGGTPGDKAQIKVIRNPTSVSFSTAVDMNANRNHASSDTLKSTTLAYKGAEAATVTGGDEALLFFQGAGRLFATINLVIGVGNSLAITIDPQVTTGSCNVYAALILYIEEDVG